jgi:glycosyltransferase involved in cell wall biosynthesis
MLLNGSSRQFLITWNPHPNLATENLLKNTLSSKPSICLLPKLEGFGGPASFQARLSQGLAAHGIEIHHNPQRSDCAAILVIGGSRQFVDIYQAKQRGVRIVQRLDGMNWMHKVRKTGIKHYLRAEWYNWMLAFTRRSLADHIIYQSEFSRDWWNSVHQVPRATNQVTYNGVDLNLYSPNGNEQPPKNMLRILVIEARFSGGYESGLENAIDFVRALKDKATRPIELMVIGEASQSLKEIGNQKAGSLIRWAGRVPREDIPGMDRSAHLLFSADVNAACPNSVVEALACGLPVIGYATGSLAELVGEDAGHTAAYGSNFWKLEPARPAELVNVSLEILRQQDRFRKGARRRAEQWFGLERMTDQYLQAFNL